MTKPRRAAAMDPKAYLRSLKMIGARKYKAARRHRALADAFEAEGKAIDAEIKRLSARYKQTAA